MTQIIGKQVNDARTRYVRIALSSNANLPQNIYAGSVINSKTISGVPGGSEDKIPPAVSSAVGEPFSIGSGVIGIRIDSGTTHSISLSSTDNNIGLIANKINASFGATIAANVNDKLQIKSNGVAGSNGTLELTNISGSIFGTLGMPVGITRGIDPGTRGIITHANNPFGGFVPLRLIGNQQIVTNATDFIQTSNAASDISYNPTIPGGLPIHGRLSISGGTYVLKYMANAPANASIDTIGSDFGSLSPSNSVTVTVTQNGLTRTFSFAFQSLGSNRNQIVDRFNSQWAAAMGIGGRVTVRGTVTQPFNFNNEIINVGINGASDVPVTLTSSDNSVVDVIAKLSAVSGLTATAVNTGNGIVILLTTSSGVGFKSSIKLSDSPNGGNNALSKLGLTAGNYLGPHMARTLGQFEMTLFAMSRGARSSIRIDSDSLSTAQFLGLSSTSVTVTASDNQSEIPVLLPFLSGYGQDPAGTDPAINSFTFEALVPEVLSFGELPTDYLSEPEKFDNSAGSTNHDPRRDFALVNSLTPSNTFGNDTRNSGQIVNVGPDGLIDFGQMRKSTDFFMNLIKQFVSGNFHTSAVSALVANKLSTPGVNNNPLPDSASLLLDIDPNGALSASSRTLDVRFASAGTPEYSFKEGVGIIQGAINLGAKFAPVLATSRITPKEVVNLASSNPSDRQLVFTTETPALTSRGKIRIYIQPGTTGSARYEIVTNAFWDGTVWTKDTASTTAAIIELGAFTGGVVSRKHVTTSTTFAESDWVENFTFPLNPIFGSENRFSSLLRLGQGLIDSNTAADNETARLVTEYNTNISGVTHARTLLWEIPFSDTFGPTIRIYAAFQSIHAGTSNNGGFEITYNARWSEAGNRWVTDSVNRQAAKFYIGDGGFGIKNTGGFPTNAFDDTDSPTGWQKTSGLTGASGSSSNEKPPSALLWKAVNAITSQQLIDIFFPGPLVLHSNTVTSNPNANALHGNLIPKVTGRVLVTNGTINQAEGFGVQFPVVSGSTITFPYLYTPDVASQAVIVSTLLLTGSVSTVQLFASTSTLNYSFSLRNTATGAAVNFSSGIFSFTYALYYEFTL